MSPFLTILIVFCVIAVVASLALGIVFMMRGGELNKKYGNKLMVARVSFQALALVLLAALWASSK